MNCGDGVNWFAYCGNNPLRFVDPAGLISDSAALVAEEEGRKDVVETRSSHGNDKIEVEESDSSDDVNDGEDVVYSDERNDQVNYNDPHGLRSESDGEIPQVPPGVSIDDNILKSQIMSTVSWVNDVREHGDWDYKELDKDGNDEFGNFNYGATGRAQGFSEETLLRAAGAFQLLSGTNEAKDGKPWEAPPLTVMVQKIKQ